LKAHRQEVSSVIRRLGHEAIGMEDYNAEGSRPLDKCLADVARCDAYVGIFGWRFGFIPAQDNPEGLSITALEYRKARELNKPLFIFLQNPQNANAALTDPFTGEGQAGALIKRLHAELTERHSCNWFDSVEDLGTKCATSLAKLSVGGDRAALRELKNLGILILKLSTFKTAYQELHDVYVGTPVLRSGRPEDATAQDLLQAARVGRDALVSIDSLLHECDAFLSERERKVNLEHLKCFSASVAQLSELAALPQPADAAGAEPRARSIDDFNYRLAAWRSELDSMSDSLWVQARLSELRARLESLRSQIPGDYIDRVVLGYTKIGEPPLFTKCDTLARLHNSLQEVLSQFSTLRRELEQLDMDELKLRCKAIKRRLGQARENWQAYAAFPGNREDWERTLLGDGEDQWEIVDQCEADVAGPLQGLEGSGQEIPAGLVDKLLRAQKFLEQHFKSVDRTLANAFGTVNEVIGRPLMDAPVEEDAHAQ
jgi:Domain of unknown function (DUF4062)